MWGCAERSPDDGCMRLLAFLGVRAPGGVGSKAPLLGRDRGVRGREFLTRPPLLGRTHSGGTAPDSHRASSPVAVVASADRMIHQAA